MGILICKYYGIDWLLFALVVLHLWLLGNRKKEAFLYALVANTCGLTLGVLIGSVATILMNVVFMVMNVRAYIKWSSYHGPEV